MTQLYTPNLENQTLTEGQKVYFAHDGEVKSGRIDGDLFDGKYSVETRNQHGQLVYWQFRPEQLFDSFGKAYDTINCPHCDGTCYRDSFEWVPYGSIQVRMPILVDCEYCNGTGMVQ